MAYKKTNWQDTLRDAQGNVIQKGTPLNAQALGKIEDGIVGAEQKIDNEISQVAQQLAQTVNVLGRDVALTNYKHLVPNNTTVAESEWDWSDALEAAINDAISKGAVLTIDGVYKIKRNGKISVTTNSYLHIFGKDITKSQLLFTSENGGIVIGNDESYTYEVKIKHITLDGTGVASELLEMKKAEQFFFDNVFIKRANVGMILNNSSLTHFTRFTISDCLTAIKVIGYSGMLTLDKFDFWNNGVVFLLQNSVARLNLLDGWAENNATMFELGATSSSTQFGRVSVRDCYLMGDGANDKILKVSRTNDYGLDMSFSSVDMIYPNTAESLLDFSGKSTGWTRKCILTLRDIYIQSTLNGTINALTKTNASQPETMFEIEVNDIKGIDTRSRLLIGPAVLQGMWSRYGKNTFLNGVNLYSTNLSSATGQLSYNSNNQHFEVVTEPDNFHRAIQTIRFGTTTALKGISPTNLIAGESAFNTTINKPVWWNGSSWVDSTGTIV